MNPIIEVEGLGKRYRIGKSVPYRTLREGLVNAAGTLTRLAGAMRYRRLEPSRKENQVWALRDVSFKVTAGEVVGLIGRNGAGKSTLLKILSRITDPTEGRAKLRGRVGSLLEVGTGFHPELTGRENTFLSGSILGMRRAEIGRKFDEIIDFAGIDKFVDTPVKHYSSGMYVRLAFAVAAHLETEILVVDEVLAVGDAAFQKKCLGKMGEVASSGRTVLFVSHNTASIESLCGSCVLLAGGRLMAKGEPQEIIARYMTSELSPHTGIRWLGDHQGRTGASSPQMESVQLYSGEVGPVSVLPIGAPLSVRVRFSATRPVRPTLGVVVRTAQGIPVFGVSNRWTNDGCLDRAMRTGQISCDFAELPLMPATYLLSLYFGDFGDITRDLDTIIDAISLEITPSDALGTGMLPNSIDGPILWKAKWSRSNDAVENERSRSSQT
jgi:lipopolysaccharide transport system ATP-binding protein